MDGKDKAPHFTGIHHAFEQKYKHDFYNPVRRRDPVLIVALRSTGHVEGLVKHVESDICKPSNRGGSDSFTKKTPLRPYICRDDLFGEARRANQMQDYLTEKMREVLV